MNGQGPRYHIPGPQESADNVCRPNRVHQRMQLIQVGPGLWAQLNGYQFQHQTILTVEPTTNPLVLTAIGFTREHGGC